MANEKTRVKLNNLGPGRGQTVHFSQSQLRKAGLDPDGALEANRYVFDGETGEIRVRIYPADD